MLYVEYRKHMECTEYMEDRGFIDNTWQECTEHAEHRGRKTLEIIECMERIRCIEYIEQSIQSM